MRKKIPGGFSSRPVCVLSALAFLLSAIFPAKAQFEFLFGRRDQRPPAEAQPSQRPGAVEAGKGKHRKSKKAAAAPKEAAKPPPPTEETLPPYDPELLRLAEILGALTYLNALCDANAPGDWRSKMQELLDSEGRTSIRRERLAGSYNRGFRDYERTYRFCTPNAQAAIGRFLAEGSKISREVVSRYGAS